MSAPVRFAVIGCGRIAQSHFDAIGSTAEATVTAVVEPRESAGQAFAEQHGCEWFSDVRNPGLADKIDAAIICTPPNTHFDLAGTMLDHGIHVLCEKPLTIRSDRARRLIDKAEERGLTLMMASKFRYVDDVIQAKALLESEALGKPVLYENTFCAPVSMAGRWNVDREISGGGVLIDNGSHSVDIARYLLGPIAELDAAPGVQTQELPVEDTVRLQFRSVSGVLGSVDLSWSIRKDPDYYIRIHGSEGRLEVGWKRSRYLREGGDWIAFGGGYDKLSAFRRQLENFIGAQRGTVEPLIRPQDALAAVELIERAYATLSRPTASPIGVAS